MEPLPPSGNIDSSILPRLGNTENKLTSLEKTFGVVMIVVVVALVSLIIQFLINSAVSFQKLDEQVSAQNAKIDILTQIDTQILLNIKGK